MGSTCECDAELYERRNEARAPVRRIKRFRRVFTRYPETDLMFGAFITINLIADMLR